MSEQVEPGRAERFLALGVSGRLAMLGRPLAAFAVRQPVGAFSAVIIVLLILVAILAPLLAPSDPYEVDAKAMFIDQGTEGRLLGGDELGRDVLSRLIHGARISLYVSLVSCLLGIAIGSAVGIVSATRGGALDLILQRVIDALMAFPNLILALAIMATMGSSLRNVIIAITIVVIPPTARGVRAQAPHHCTYGLHNRGSGRGGRVLAHHLQARTTQLPLPSIHLGLGDLGGGDHHRKLPELPGAGRASRRAFLGRHDRRRPDLPLPEGRSDPCGLPCHRHRPCCVCFQCARGRPA